MGTNCCFLITNFEKQTMSEIIALALIGATSPRQTYQ